MKVVKTTANRNRLTSEIDLFSDLPVDKGAKKEIAEAVGEYIKEQTLLSVAEARTPVSGAPYVGRLTSKRYAKDKAEAGLPPKANMEFSGSMLNALKYRETDNGIEIGIYGEAAERADGHNNFSGASSLPPRQFLPKEGEVYKTTIQKGIEQIIKDKQVEQIDFTRSMFATLRTKEELFSRLKEILPQGWRKPQIVKAVTRDERLMSLLNEFNLLRFLYGED